MIKKYNDILNLNKTIAKDLFDSFNYPWEVLPELNRYILEKVKELDDNYLTYGNNVYIHKSANISPNATIIGPAIIGENVEIRQCAYIRGNVIIGNNSVIGNSTEVKNSIIFNNVQCPHFNYVGDSILGEHSHLGAGVILSNVKSDKTNIKLKIDNEIIDTNLHKFSSILGDNVEVGCNSVLCPGTIIYPNTNIYPLTRVRGIIESNKIVKSMENIVDKENI